MIAQLYKTNYTHELVLQSKVFALNFLRRDQLQLLMDLGLVSGRDCDKLADIRYRTGVTGSPIFDDCFGSLDCRVINAMDGGDLTCFLADVVDGESRGGEAMTWPYARTAVPKEWLEEYGRKIQKEIQVSLSRMDSIDRSAFARG